MEGTPKPCFYSFGGKDTLNGKISKFSTNTICAHIDVMFMPSLVKKISKMEMTKTKKLALTAFLTARQHSLLCRALS